MKHLFKGIFKRSLLNLYFKVLPTLPIIFSLCHKIFNSLSNIKWERERERERPLDASVNAVRSSYIYIYIYQSKGVSNYPILVTSQTWKPLDANIITTLHIRMEPRKFFLIQIWLAASWKWRISQSLNLVSVQQNLKVVQFRGDTQPGGGWGGDCPWN